ncbi:Thioesterase/thiol ester dehydrase-isomerase [Marasmius fiardii PR-910]|nr:Thioesterase/thiol ester dehydrase-isomerase [Marasmius fiardii PR-910]
MFSMSSTNGDFPAALIKGNASDNIKRTLGDPRKLFLTKDREDGSWKSMGYSMEIFKRLLVTEIWFQEHLEETTKFVCKVTCELEVQPDMANNDHHLHGGCSAYLVDMCSNIAFLAHGMAINQSARSVSQQINTLYHSPASVGERLRIVSTTMSVGERIMTARIEIWSATKHRLVASGIHTMMLPSTGTSSQRSRL